MEFVIAVTQLEDRNIGAGPRAQGADHALKPRIFAGIAVVRSTTSSSIHRFFVTDDNFARNRNRESLFDRMIRLRLGEGLKIGFTIQVDTLCHRIPNFIEKATGYWSVYWRAKRILKEALAARDRWAYSDLSTAPPREEEFDALDVYRAQIAARPRLPGCGATNGCTEVL